MKIGINLFPLERDKWSGIEVYTYELIKYLNKYNFDLNTYSLSKIKYDLEIEKTNYNTLNVNNPNSFDKLYFNLYGISKQVSDIDVYHSTSFILPYFLKAKKKIITIHDFAFIKHPELFDYKTKMYYKLVLEHSIKSADRIICISKSCLEDFNYYYPNSEYLSKTRLVYNGFKDFSKIDAIVKNEYGDYLLCVGASHERKNLKRILDSFCLLKKEIPNLKLIITGSDPNNLIKKYNQKNKDFSGIIHLIYVSENELINLYKNALLLMFPSLYEGFGFPILESMSLGTLVLTSATSSCGEISGYPSELLVDPYSIKDIVLKTKLLLDPCNRNVLIRHGYNRIKDFSWEKMGEQTQLVYND
jgi:glycosyltransferase involved in cell wall biosynthesis